MGHREKREFVGFDRLQLVSPLRSTGELFEPLGTLSVRLESLTERRSKKRTTPRQLRNVRPRTPPIPGRRK
jgi:hypothetical protein